ncbi:C45 family peptidase [Clostridium tyrobutyricum]|uniref:C45 family peptidase n=1 Tax=Clostridium tyrobutyricum TaxID=1519 RepID=UPI002B20847E|nr:C45 family peptidase [Clostridium tyrobutyricum]MEA5009163.1 C45 family peptidase [Clostridium tyrobutyricum]
MITKTNAFYKNFEGTPYEIGKQLGEMCLQIPEMVKCLIIEKPIFSSEELKEIYNMFDLYCYGINEEIRGFADVINVSKEQVLYYTSTYLKCGCSLMTVLPSKINNGHMIMARNYDFSDKMEDIILVNTKVTGKYAHTGSLISMFGRGDGMNDQGLAACQASAGIPVGNFDGGRKPAIAGLQFWAVIRSILENCKDVTESVEYVMRVPLAYNINLMIADKFGNAVLIESYDGKKAFKKCDKTTNEQFLCATNHLVLPELSHFEPMHLKTSDVRYKLIQNMLTSKAQLSIKNLKQLLSEKYPKGLCCHYYDEFFGTLRAMVFDVTDSKLEICFGSPNNNQWYTFKVNESVTQEVFPVNLEREKAPDDFYDIV